MITNEQLYQTIVNAIENISSIGLSRDDADDRIIQTLQDVYNTPTEQLKLYFIHYDDDSSDYEKVADAVFEMINNKKVLNYTVVRYSDYDMGIAATIIQK